MDNFYERRSIYDKDFTFSSSHEKSIPRYCNTLSNESALELQGGE